MNPPTLRILILGGSYTNRIVFLTIHPASPVWKPGDAAQLTLGFRTSLTCRHPRA